MFFLGFVRAMQILFCGEYMEEYVFPWKVHGCSVYLGDSFQKFDFNCKGSE